MKNVKIIIIFSFVSIIIFNSLFSFKCSANSVSVPVSLPVIVQLIINLAVNSDVYNNSKTVASDLTDEENKANAELEQQYLQEMLEYYDTYGGDPNKIAVITASGTTLTLEEALQAATSMSMDDYIKMRKQSSSPTPTPGIDWGSIFIDNAVGGLMDFLASFLNKKLDEKSGYKKPYTIYTGDSGYVNRSTGEVFAFVETDGVTSGKLSKGKYCVDYEGTVAEEYRSSVRMAVLLRSANSSGSSFITRYNSGGGIVTDISSSVLGQCRLDVYITKYSGSGETLTLFFGLVNSSGSPIGIKTPGYWQYAFKGGNDITEFTYFSTNLPVFVNYEEMEAYLIGNSGAKDSNTKRTTVPDIICNNYKNKVVSLTTVKDYGVTPTPTPIPATPTPKPTATPTPTPYPTWDKNSGNGDNFTTYNFYTEISNILNPISTTITNIYNFFVIDTVQIENEFSFDGMDTTQKFVPIINTFTVLKQKFPEDSYSEESGFLIADYPKITMQCPKIFKSFINNKDVNGKQIVKTEADSEDTLIVLVDFADYAIYFVRFRAFLKAVIWIGMIFLLMKELSVTFNVS